MAAEPPEKLVGALVGGLRVLRYLSAAPAGVGVTRVARDLQLNSSTCYNFLKTLVYEGLVTFDESTKTYSIALGLVELAKGVLEQGAYVRLIHPHLEEIARAHRVTATLWQRTSNERVVLVDRADNDSSVRVHMSVGQRLPMYIAALGRCMAANAGLDREQLEQRFDALRWDDKPPFDEYLAGVEEARKNGYATDAGHYVKGVSTASAAVLDAFGKPVMAISAVGFSAQFTGDALERLGQDLRERAGRITRALSGGRAGADA
ncbi:IclR family transcriptional regulator [Bordetella bronchiseptica]|uniref:Probable transcriptional regulator n=1 Tax=Bordetella bronchiseptica (strain ATCC BAA-588 / NCTC 13252 / RB50) TaxID=257310 RepID=A0A0H3LT61_BORBR|nr:IclR family transcriptional regulator [Bordetella bronchiseptica]KAK61824.1 transcriptional regulator, IclR family, C-terminal domain protein [Bordetella bronchiseptica 980-2]AMG90643.1 IclR family transcriptional regulator [Bordetella bronchiseptica]AWP82039.1 IclR family transcriptional regulator [Bordetella bronchiseptica]AWP86834.1 IclR family transcriptional regulator [Bordetella bronchiseptica]AWQ12404.1 IclR family transcriptional regulator [Bordetella bronchiseptica]